MCEKKQKFYIVSHGGLQDPFWKPVKKGMETAANLLDVNAEYLGPKERYSLEELESNVEEIRKKTEVSGLAVTITNAKRLDCPLREIIKKDIPIIAINVPDFRGEDKRIPYQFYIGMNEYACGERLARWMLEKNQRLKRPVIAIHEKEHPSLKKRADGIKDVLRSEQIQADEIYITTDSPVAVETFKKYREEHPENDAIFTLGPLGTKPALDFLSEKELFNKVKFATVDLTPETLNGIKTDKNSMRCLPSTVSTRFSTYPSVL